MPAVKFSFDKTVEDLIQKNDGELDTCNILNYDDTENFDYNEQQSLVNHTIDHITRDETGRITVPIMWDSRNSHHLAKNPKCKIL